MTEFSGVWPVGQSEQGGVVFRVTGLGWGGVGPMAISMFGWVLSSLLPGQLVEPMAISGLVWSFQVGCLAN